MEKTLRKAKLIFAALLIICVALLIVTNKKVLLFGEWPNELAKPLFANNSFETYWATGCWQIKNISFARFSYAIIDTTDLPESCASEIIEKLHGLPIETITTNKKDSYQKSQQDKATVTAWQKNNLWKQFFTYLMYIGLTGLTLALIIGLFYEDKAKKF
jgi:hypothetical protein